MSVITISRQYASGGSDIAKLVSADIGWTLIDNELVDRVAQRAGVSREEVEIREERVSSLIERLAGALSLSSPYIYVGGSETTTTPLPDEPNLAHITETVISEAVRDENVVLVGRGAQAYLAEREDALHVFIVAPREARVKCAVERLEVSRREAEKSVDEFDKGRRKYVKAHYDRIWDDPTNYHLVLNTDEFSYREAADIIVCAAKQRGW